MIFETSIGHTGHPLYRYRDGPNSAYIMRLENGGLAAGCSCRWFGLQHCSSSSRRESLYSYNTADGGCVDSAVPQLRL